MADTLIPVKMQQADMQLPEVQAFDCGTEAHDAPLAHWIKVHSADEIHRGDKIWLFRRLSVSGPLVGYGSLSPGQIAKTNPDGSKTSFDPSGNIIAPIKLPE